MSSQDIVAFYSSPQNGGELPYFVGKQYGSGWLKTLGRFALPILRSIGGVAAKTANAVFNRNSKVLPALKNYALSEVSNLGSQALDALNNHINKPKDSESESETMVGRSKRHSSSSINKRQKLRRGTIFGK